MPADLTKPFDPSCCDGGECSTSHESAQPCGCDKGANWMCEHHKKIEGIKELMKLGREDLEKWMIENGKA